MMVPRHHRMLLVHVLVAAAGWTMVPCNHRPSLACLRDDESVVGQTTVPWH